MEGSSIVFEKPKSQEQITNETRERERHEFARDQVKTNRRLTWLTFGLVAGSLAGTVIGIWQATISQTSANAAKEAADAATDASYMACLGAKVAQNALIQQEAGGMDAHRFAQSSVYQAVAVTRSQAARLEKQVGLLPLSIGHPIFSHFNIKNIGPTEALDIKVDTGSEISFMGKDPKIAYPKHGFKVDTPLLEPGQFLLEMKNPTVTVETPNGKDILIDKTLYDNFTSGRLGIIVFARLTYADVFGIRHWQHYCHFFNVAVPTEGAISSGHETCVAYNQSDKNQLISSSDTITSPPSSFQEVSCPVPSGYYDRQHSSSGAKSR
jgi:hypothetical protein